MTSNDAVQASQTTVSIPEVIPETMKAAVLRDHEVGLQIETLRTPRPQAGEVLIKVAACGLCHSDLHAIARALAFPLPAVPGPRTRSRRGTTWMNCVARGRPRCRRSRERVTRRR